MIRLDLLRHRSYGVGQILALTYFAGFTSLFSTVSILWQEGLGRSALDTGLLAVPFALGSLLSASNSARFSSRFGGPRSWPGPPREAGTVGGALITAQRIGAAIGIAVIGTALFGSGGGSSGKIMPQYVHTAQTATLANLALILVAIVCARALPRRLGDERDEANR